LIAAGKFTALLLVFSLQSSSAQSKAPKPPPKTAKSAPQKTDPFQLLLNQADEALAKEDFPAAIAALEKYSAGRPEEAYGFFQLAYAHTGAKHWDLARTAYARAISLDPKMGAAYLNLGLIVLDTGAPKDAIEPLRKAAELLPERAQVKYLLGTALERDGQTEPALASYRAAIAQDGKDPTFHLALGRALLNAGKAGPAQTSFKAALALRPDVAGARLGLAQCLLAQEKWEPAAAELENYLRSVPEDTASRLQRAHALLQMDAAEPALAELDRADTSSAPSPASQRMRVEALLILKRFDDAAILLPKVIALAPEDAELHAKLGRLYLGQRNFTAAEQSLVAALRLQPQMLEAMRDLASTYYLGENYPAALRTQDSILKRETPNAFFWFVRATCFDKLGWKPQALETYEKFLALDQGHSDKQDFQARERIKVIRRELERQK